MIKKIITIPDKILRIKSKRIGYIDDSIRQLAEDMMQTTIDWEHGSEDELGAALAAIQVGEPLRLTVVRENFDYESSKKFVTLVNPTIVKTSTEKITDIEGCISTPGIYGRVERFLKVKVKAQDINGNEVRLSLEGFPARVLQHEIDHMQGILFLDHVKDSKNLLSIDKNGQLSPLTNNDKVKLPDA